MEILNKATPTTPVKAVVFDFDGTLSTLRSGWEEVMKPLMLEMISGTQPVTPALEKEVDDYINESTGIQTIHQMKWLAARAAEQNPGAPMDPWWYKGEYNRRLMLRVAKRVQAVENGEIPAEARQIKGSEAFLKALCERGVRLYAASGTDHPDVCHEADVLGLGQYFTQIAGAPLGEENCSKEKVIEQLLKAENLSGSEVAVIGDGKVEIRLGAANGMRTVGLASNELEGGVDAVKRERLIAAGADVICGDFTEFAQLMHFLGLNG